MDNRAGPCDTLVHRLLVDLAAVTVDLHIIEPLSLYPGVFYQRRGHLPDMLYLGEC